MSFSKHKNPWAYYCGHYFHDTAVTMSLWHFIVLTIVTYSRFLSKLNLKCEIRFKSNFSEMVPWS